MAHLLVDQRRVEFVLDEKVKQELQFVEDAKPHGYKAELPTERVADRAEFGHLKKKKSDCMASSLKPNPAPVV